MVKTTPEPPSEFLDALYSLRKACAADIYKVMEVPPPKGIAPYSAALALEAITEGKDSIHAHGRFIVLYDPEGQETWGGRFRLVMMIHCITDSEIANDPVIKTVAWDWLHEAFDSAGAAVKHLTGTVTTESSQSFGGLKNLGDTSSIEIRASWSPLTNSLESHLEAWATLAILCSGREPVAQLKPVIDLGSRA
ncbi:DUF3000 domain-containing protein [Actinomycetaceae bacterium TAE3-ERU4]|nr:DUF3000 domain-containing protein [Actinomycetaceae bacterium TAE3-ERU4]